MQLGQRNERDVEYVGKNGAKGCLLTEVLNITKDAEGEL